MRDTRGLAGNPPSALYRDGFAAAVAVVFVVVAAKGTLNAASSRWYAGMSADGWRTVSDDGRSGGKGHSSCCCRRTCR